MRSPVLLLTIGVAVVLAFVVLPLRSPSSVIGTHAMPCGDLDGNGAVTLIDIAIELSYDGQTVPPAPLAADMDGDTDVDQDDVDIVSSQFGEITDCQDTPIGFKPPTPTPTITPTPTVTSTPTATPTKDPSADTDADGCTDVAEQQPKSEAGTGGGRDPNYYWDFMDMWVNKLKDRRVNIIDIGAISKRFFTVGDPGGDPLDPPQDLTSYHVSADRSPPIGPNLWNAGPPDGDINIIEMGLAVVQFGDNCSGSP